MIRKMQKSDIDDVAGIWLDTNITAHSFISAHYWTDNFELVKEMLQKAEVYVYEDENVIKGFIGLTDSYIDGIFVRSEAQSGGIGKQLLDFVKGIKTELTLNVYQKNTRAVSFYLREKFRNLNESVDINTGEKEYAMIWMNGPEVNMPKA